MLYKQLLTKLEYNVLLASIMGDGTLAKITAKSRRVNSNYREHFGVAQLQYRQWKVQKLNGLLYFNKNKSELLSKSLPLFTELEQLFYDEKRFKRIPNLVLPDYTLPVFLATLYMDDGSLSISYRVNHRLQKIYLTPHIYLYLQSFKKSNLETLQRHIFYVFNLDFSISQRKDGTGYVLKTTKVSETLKFLQAIHPDVLDCPSMFYKTN